ncbi:MULTISPECIES: 50S ribosomal protein L25/general stress protein Ctc [unclassified Thalassotalea]|uniref:50S ribosomal protein L25/general stress protein Ctc n=1 Tax=unclassified Thalassotalea TaxID=2614972 RepID=UPI0010802AD1|nr:MULTISPECIES: 50S ribosomal protein L25/general stress protein Ctc [unclassified Thalassotalea]NMP16402.1 50S ribosomal protein L25/general stress protein Ctc [Thalassotalea sp. Y01]QBY03224.1 50S ribosomal protein L25/general stress protein Ctc [Thalassotalea sp. HSM 43]
MDILNLDAEVRTDLGKGASRRLRHANKVPAIVYGTGADAVSITLAHNKVYRAQEEEAFYSQVLTLNVDGKSVDVVLKDMQRHPFKQQIMHLDFLRVDAKKELHQHVPLHFINEEEVTKGGVTLAHTANDIEVACLPADLPEFIEVDCAGMEVGQTLHLSDITLPKGVTSVELAKGEDHDQAVVSANAPKAASSDSEEADEAAAEGGEEAAEE